MKSQRAVLVLLLAAALVASSCNSRAERTDGTVLLEVSSLGTVPVSLSLSQAASQSGSFQLPLVTLVNVLKDPAGVGSSFQDIELRTYQVTYRRRDTGTRVPPSITGQISGTVPAGGTGTLTNLPFFTNNQLLSVPLSDLTNFGKDTETGSAVIVLDVSYQFFGRTVSGDDVASQVSSFTLEVLP
ncbi:MAG TPA: hypothetical protein VIE43_13520 [Thermoanaerobaculia bacterium]|jgi:hypothetical protein|nr:hypothetical protein [Thermoanaerobaculia bacterium]